MPGHQSLDQRRAGHAWQLVAQVKAADEKARKDFKVQAKRLPARIMAAGLGQSLAFLEAKRTAPLLLAALADWVNQRGPAGPRDGEARLLLRIVRGDSDFLRFATAECLAYLQWVVRFADAELAGASDVEEA
jgi:CRISPR-associated protein Cmr5